MTSYHWEIEFVPDDPEQITPADTLPFDGNYREACGYADANHPDYLCQEITLHRCGEVLKGDQPCSRH